MARRTGQQSGSRNTLEAWLEHQHAALARFGTGHVFKVPNPVAIEKVVGGRVTGRLESPIATDFAGTVEYGMLNVAADSGGHVMVKAGRAVYGEAKSSLAKSGINLSEKHLRGHQRRFLQAHANLGAIVWIHFQRRYKDAPTRPDTFCVPVTKDGPTCFDWEVTHLSWKKLEPWRLPAGRSWVDCAVGFGRESGLFWEFFCAGGWPLVAEVIKGGVRYG